jgi:hypothetical protein
MLYVGAEPSGKPELNSILSNLVNRDDNPPSQKAADIATAIVTATIITVAITGLIAFSDLFLRDLFDSRFASVLALIILLV